MSSHAPQNQADRQLLNEDTTISVSGEEVRAAVAALDAEQTHLLQGVGVRGPRLRDDFDHLRLKLTRARQSGELSLTREEAEFLRSCLSASSQCGGSRVPGVRSLLDRL